MSVSNMENQNSKGYLEKTTEQILKNLSNIGTPGGVQIQVNQDAPTQVQIRESMRERRDLWEQNNIDRNTDKNDWNHVFAINYWIAVGKLYMYYFFSCINIFSPRCTFELFYITSIKPKQKQTKIFPLEKSLTSIDSSSRKKNLMIGKQWGIETLGLKVSLE